MLKVKQKVPKFNNIEYGPEVRPIIVNTKVDNTKLPPLTRATAAGTAFKRKYLKSIKSKRRSKKKSR